VIAQILDFILTFQSILWEALPFIVLGALVAGVLEELLPQQLVTRFMPKGALPAVLIGGLLGLVFPMCECGIVVVMRRLLRKGVPLSCCITYMLAGPIVNLVVLLSTFVAFDRHKIGWDMVILRAGMGFVVATITGLIVNGYYRKHGTKLLTALAAPRSATLPMADDDEEKLAEKPKPLMKRLANISSTALHDFMDITVFLILGAILASVIKMMIEPGEIERISNEQPYLAIPLMMLMAVLMCLCSEADAFVAASFTKMQISAKLAFLVLGPMLDLKLLLMYTRVFKTKLILVIVTCVVVQVGIYSMLVHTFYAPKLPLPTAVVVAK